MFKKEIPIIFIGLYAVIAALVLGWSVFVREEAVVPVQAPVVGDKLIEDSENDDAVSDDVENDIFDIESNNVSESNDLNGKIYKMVDISDKFLFVENSSVHPMKTPHSSLPDTIHILDILKSNKPIVSIETNILPEERTSYKLFEDRIYFFSRKDKMVEWMDFNGNIYKLAFTKVDDWTYSNYFLISPNNQKIIWVETSGWDENNKMNSKLVLADLDGQNKKILLEKSFGFREEKYFQPIRWSNSNEEIYFTEQHGGLGGYFVFFNPINLSKANINTGKIEHLFDEGRVGDISPNEEFMAYFAWKEYKPKTIIRNMKTGTENIFDIPIEENFKLGGNAYFSPDNKYLVYNIAYHNPDNERFRTIVVGSTKKEQKTIVDDPQKKYEVMGWVSNDKILLCDFDDNTYIVNIDGSDFKKIGITE
ncbi:MAG: hypothetical protein U9N53_05515 [Bacteroidota bacterium]|nr:hypothetical protein [Bacteroidota bacterium]